MTQEQTINNTITIINNKLNIVLPNSNDILDYNNYLDIVLNIVKKPKFIPRSWIDEKQDLEKRLSKAHEELEDNEASYVRGDSFGDGMPHSQSDPLSEERKHARRLELKDEIIPLLESKLNDINKKISILDMDFDNNVKDVVKEFIELVPNEKHKDIMKQFYIYRKTYKVIAADSFIAEETAKDYRKRGFKSLSGILFNFSKKTH